jgi:hypothetical protein
LRSWWVATDEDGKAYITPAIVLVYRGKTVRFGVGKLYRDEAEYLVSLIIAVPMLAVSRTVVPLCGICLRFGTVKERGL